MYWENINWWIQKGRRPLKFFFFDQNFEEKKTRLVQLQKKNVNQFLLLFIDLIICRSSNTYL